MDKYNPFNPNSVVAPTLFAGRNKQMIRIINKLSQVKKGMPANFIFHGERGIGKTALAKLVLYASELNDSKLGNLNFLTSYYSVEQNQNFQAVFQAVLNSLTDKLPINAIERLNKRMGNLFKQGKFSFGAFGVNASIESGESNENQSEQYFKDQALSVLTNILLGIKEVGEGKIKYDGLLIVLDEIHNTQDIKGIAQLLRSITTTLDVNRLGFISFIVIGYSQAINEFFEGDPSAKRSFDSIPLKSMPPEEAKEVLIKGFDEAGVKYNQLEFDKYVISAGGYPHSLQILGHNIIELDTDNIIDDHDWKNAIHSAARELQTKDFSVLYNFTGKQTMRDTLVNILAWVGIPINKSLIAKEMKSNIYTSSCLPALKKSGAVQEDLATGDLFLHSMLFQSAILLHLLGKEPVKMSDENWFKIGNKIREILKKTENF